MNPPDRQTANSRLAFKIMLISLGMFGFGFAMVPFYDLLCQVTGLNGKPEAAARIEAAYEAEPDRTVTLEFITSLNENMPLTFRPEVSKLNVVPGRYYTVNFYAKNVSGHSIAGQAVPSIAPGLAAQYLQKTQCFCFSRQEFEPGKERAMPVRFVIDPKLPKDVNDLTLAYTFFDVTNQASTQ
jgi:cytochrome c oxidase assembly protein subunit 11